MKEKIEFRYYEMPQGFPLIALMGKDWEIPYGRDPMHFHNHLEIGIEQNRCAMACQGCGAVFYSF